MTAAQLTTDVTAVQGVATTILSTIEAVDPAVGVPAEEAAVAIALVAQLVTAALTAWSNASGTAITADSITALLPDSTPLPEPPAGS
jgi:hypothetical protein